MKSIKLFLITFVFSFIPIVMLFGFMLAGIGGGCSGFYCDVVRPSIGLGGILSAISAMVLIRKYKVTGNLFSNKISLIVFTLSVLTPVFLFYGNRIVWNILN